MKPLQDRDPQSRRAKSASAKKTPPQDPAPQSPRATSASATRRGKSPATLSLTEPPVQRAPAKWADDEVDARAYDSEAEEVGSTSIVGDTFKEEDEVSAVAEPRPPGPYNAEWEVGNMGLYCGNWGNRASTGKVTAQQQAEWDTHDLQLINAPGQVIGVATPDGRG